MSFVHSKSDNGLNFGKMFSIYFTLSLFSDLYNVLQKKNKKKLKANMSTKTVML